MSFNQLNQKLQKQFKVLNNNTLFRVNISGKELWDVYLNSFSSHPIWRVNSVHNCDNDRHFFERYANVVAIIDNQIVTMFDFEANGEYTKSIKAVSDKIKSSEIISVFIESFNELKTLGSVTERNKMTSNQSEYRLGVEKTLKQYNTVEEALGKEIGKVYTFYHFNVFLAKKFVDFSNKSSAAILGDLNTTKQLFEKGLSIPLETLELVRDLIQQGSLLRGDMYLPKVLEFIKLKKQFEQIPTNQRQNWLWINFQSIPYARFANELIGTTCIELAEGKELNEVCKSFNYRVDPANYGKAVAPRTPQMLANAEKTIIDLGYSESFERRFATIDDIDVLEIKHSNIDNAVEKPLGLFAKAGVPVKSEFSRHKRAEFDKVETVTIDKFMSDILPNTTSMEVFMENRMGGNLVSLFTTVDKSVKNLFKWSNPFSWTYNGNLSGKSMIKQTVSSKGGKVDGVVRCSIVWNEEKQNDRSDLDLWCKQPANQLIGYSKGFRKDAGNELSSCGGQLDDMGSQTEIHAENIYFISKDRLLKGNYEFWVNQYSAKNSRGFKAEIEVNGDIYTYSYDKPVVGNVKIADVKFDGVDFTLTHHLPETLSSSNLWNLETNQFHKVNLVCTSPNHWLDNNIGTKEYFFMLQDCKTNVATRAFHVDQLNSELMSVRKDIDMLGNYKLVEPADKQLSGIGFNSTVRDELIVRVKGTHQRVLKITF
jgi:hypothetical protein